MTIKYILLVIILLIILKITGKFRSRELAGREYLLWLVVWVGGAFVILRPETATFVANLVGVGRGTDFMVYISVTVLFYLVFRILVRQEKTEREITKIVREIAINQSVRPLGTNNNEYERDTINK